MENEEEVYTVYVTEKLQRELEIAAPGPYEALDEAERLYHEGEVVLDYSDLVSTEFTSEPISRKEIDILDIIGKTCRNCKNLESSSCSACSMKKIETLIQG